MTPPSRMLPTGRFSLVGKRGLVLGIANEHSIAAGCARVFAEGGATLAATYLNDKAKPFVAAVTEALPCRILLPCDVQRPGALEAVFAQVAEAWGGLDFLLHSIAYAPATDLLGRVVDSSAAGFAEAMDISCHSFLRAARLAEPLMPQGGTLLAVTFYGSKRVVPHYDLMGPVKAALESAVRYAAAEWGRAASASMRSRRGRSAPAPPAVSKILMTCWPPRPPLPNISWLTLTRLAVFAAFLVSDAARMITGTIIPIDGGQHLLA